MSKLKKTLFYVCALIVVYTAINNLDRLFTRDSNPQQLIDGGAK